MSRYMDELLEREGAFIQGFNFRHIHPHLGRPCKHCSKSDASHRCISCFSSPLLCGECTVNSHIHMPFHTIEVWNGSFFARTDLRTLGLIVSAHEGGGLCPHRRPNETTIPLTVVDVSGVHMIAFAYCYCPGRLEPLQQLLALQLWPATIRQPATVFTFAMLDDYHHHSLASRKSAQDYWEVLRRKTNNDFPEEVPVCHYPFII